MTITQLLEKVFKWISIISLLIMTVTYFQKDQLPDPADYSEAKLPPPIQKLTKTQPFTTQVNGQTYHISPKYDYELEGIIVSYHDSDAFSDNWHHDKWKDFINVRDLCVIWGNNLSGGVYQDMDFKNDSWTCWAYWPNSEVGRRFNMSELSNNHLLADNDEINQQLMQAEPGDHIRLRGMLSHYANPSNGFNRGTSTVRTDTGNGACETIYLKQFEIIQKANTGMRRAFTSAQWTAGISIIGSVLFFFLAPIRRA